MRVNYLAVLVAALVYFFLGFLWYGVLFRDAWMKWERPLAPTPNGHNIPLMYLFAFVLALVLCWALALVCEWRKASLVSGAGLGLLMWIGFVMTTTFTTTMFEERPHHLFAINYGYCLTGMVIAGAILGAWKRKSA